MTCLVRVPASFLLVALVSLASACGEQGDGNGGTGGQPGTGSGPSDGSTGGSSSGGNSSGGSSSGGSSSGGSSSGGSSSGGSASGGSPSGGNSGAGGAADPYEGYPDWVSPCAVQRGIAQCPSCMDPECIVCTYGTDEEIEDTEAECSASDDAYAAACDCTSCENTSGTCRFP